MEHAPPSANASSNASSNAPQATPRRARAGADTGRADTKTLGAAIRLFYSFPGPKLLTAMLAIAWAWRLWVGVWSVWDVAVMAAILLFWPVQEWLIHVFILHFRPRRLFGRWIDLYSAKRHREHHEAPWQIDHVFIPVPTLVTAAIALVVVWGFAAARGYPLLMSTIAFFLLLALTYEWTHYLIHTNYRPKSAFYRRLWQNHRLHHFKNENYWFGVSMLSGDRILGTAPPVEEVDTSPTCRTIHARER